MRGWPADWRHLRLEGLPPFPPRALEPRWLVGAQPVWLQSGAEARKAFKQGDVVEQRELPAEFLDDLALWRGAADEVLRTVGIEPGWVSWGLAAKAAPRSHHVVGPWFAGPLPEPLPMLPKGYLPANHIILFSEAQGSWAAPVDTDASRADWDPGFNVPRGLSRYPRGLLETLKGPQGSPLGGRRHPLARALEFRVLHGEFERLRGLGVGEQGAFSLGLFVGRVLAEDDAYNERLRQSQTKRGRDAARGALLVLCYDIAYPLVKRSSADRYGSGVQPVTSLLFAVAAEERLEPEAEEKLGAYRERLKEALGADLLRYIEKPALSSGDDPAQRARENVSESIRTALRERQLGG
jgi:hypothetical protein